MSVGRAFRGVFLGVLASVALSLAPVGPLGPLGPVAPVAAASSWADFGKPAVESSFTSGVRFSQPVTIARALARVELLLTVANAGGPTVIPLPAPSGIGARILTHLLDPAVDGHLPPNTPLAARWRLVSAEDPTVVEIGPEVRVTYADDRFDWQTEAGALVRVHWYEGTNAFGARALRIGEDAVREASELLQVTETDPVDFYIYANQEPFRDALGPGTRENVGGAQIPGLRTMFALIPPDEIDDAWVGTVVPHELTHLVFETAADNPYHFPPRWLNEGLAVYQTEGYGSSDRSRVEDGTRAGTLIPLDGLVGQFPTNTDGFYLAYAESVSAVEYLVRTHGQDPLVSLIRSYANGRTDDEAFSAALGVDMSAFGAAWLEDLGAAAPTRYGPQSAPPGPIPSAWLVESGATAPPAASSGPALSPQASATPGEGSPRSVEGGPLPLVLLVGGIAVLLIAVGLAARRHRIDPGGPG